MARKQDGGDLPGNAMASALAVQRQFVRMGELIARTENTLDTMFEDGVIFGAVRFKAPAYAGQQWLAVVQVTIDDAAMVAFVSSDTFMECLLAVLNRLENKSFKWKEDAWKK